MPPIEEVMSRTDTEHGDPNEANQTQPQHSQALVLDNTTDSNPNVLTIDWDGPDDPENPRKYAFTSTSRAIAHLSCL
jgi:hypothetical protein